MPIRGFPTLLVAVAATLLLVPGRADAQDALGSGNALDGNLRQDSGGRNLPAPVPDFRARNLLITGDVPGGRGFRGAVGYLAAGDFGGTLGSDDLFRFRADAALSSLPFVASGATAERLRFGAALAYNQLTYRRTTSPPADVHLAPTVVREDLYIQDRIRLDRFIQAASGTELVDAVAEPSVVGYAVNRTGQALRVSTSSLRGVSLQPAAEQEAVMFGLSLYDQLRLREDEAEGVEAPPVGTPFEVQFQLPAGGGRIDEQPTQTREETEPLAGRIEAVQGPDYDRILQRLVTRFAEQENVTLSLDRALVDRLGEDYAQLRSRLVGSALAPADTAAGPGLAIPEAGTPSTTEPAPTGLERPPIGPGVPLPRGTEEPEAEEGEEKSLAEYGIMLRHGERVAQLAGDEQGRFTELLRSAEERLRKGEYFWAERRFIRALRFVPGHPLATAGLGHAQLGAGLYGSASLTLRSLLTHQPEMIDVRYEEGLLPPRLRLLQAAEDLRRGPHLAEDRAARGFLIAYLAHQLDDPMLRREGLGLMAEEDSSDPLLQLLREIWLPESPQTK